MPQLILTALGNDRPGIVGELTGHLHAASANILDSRMVNLRGRFAILMLLEVPDAAALRQSLPRASEKMGLALQFTEQSPPQKPAATGLPFKLRTYSLDQPGLVHRVSEVLRAHNINIEDLIARQISAPFSGDALFTMEMRLTIPANVPVKKLRSDLEAACEKLNADLDLEPA